MQKGENEMSNFRIYKYLTYNRSKILKSLFLIAIILLASVSILYLVKFFLPQGTSMSFTLEYLNPDENFSEFDYSGIENNVYLKHFKNTSWMVMLT